MNVISRPHFLYFVLAMLMVWLLSFEAMAQCNTTADDGSFDCAGYTASNSGGECVSPAYIDSISGTESGGRYNCTNNIGANGRYQFMPATRQDLCTRVDPSLPCVSQGAFANCPALQDAYFQAFNKDNYNALENCGAFNKVGSTINGAQVSESCLMAAAHLGGAGGACKWANSNGAYDPDDGATSLTDYCNKHGGIPVFASGSECESPATGTPEPEACRKGPGLPVCELLACSIGTNTGFCSGPSEITSPLPTPPPLGGISLGGDWCETPPTSSDAAARIAESANNNIGASTADVAATEGGALGCALAVSRMLDCAGCGVGEHVGTGALQSALEASPCYDRVDSGTIDQSQLQPGDVLVTPRGSRAGHTGVYVGEGNIVSNSSSGFAGSDPGTLQQNYDVGSWNSGVVSRNSANSGVYRRVPCDECTP